MKWSRAVGHQRSTSERHSSRPWPFRGPSLRSKLARWHPRTVTRQRGRPSAPSTPPDDANPYGRWAAAIEARDAASAPYVLHGLILGAAAERGWSSPRAGALA